MTDSDPRIQEEDFHLPGRDGVARDVTGIAYPPRDARAQIASGAGGRFALAGAKCERQLPARYGPAPEVLEIPAFPPFPAMPAHGGERRWRPSRIRDHL